MRKSFWWILTALVPAFTLAAMTLSPANLEKALVAQRQLAIEHPGDAKVFNDLGNLLVLARQLADAEAAYGRSLEIDPGRVTARFNRGLLLQQVGRYREALGDFQQVVKQDPNYAWAYYQMGSIYERWQVDDKAVDAYAQAFRLDSQLAFPEVNPHVIDNRLLTEALLKAHRGPTGMVGTMAPKAYEDGERIARILVPEVEMPGELVDEGAMPAEDEPASQGGVQPPPVDRPEGEPQASARVLTEGDLDRTAKSNQAAPAARGSVPRGVGSSGRPTAYRPPRVVHPSSATAIPNRDSPGSSTTGQRVTPGVVGVPVTPPANTPGFGPNKGRPLHDSEGRVQLPPIGSPTGLRPGTSSTGRLEMKLLPRPGGEPAATTLAAG